ncbi:39S ribosomal protein L55 [Tropilaelaps mercedesae]|uniref:39S ribosomal protein L55 n=1 Tax=Tropilaelaps mercedesae TaxID=418985 RepID=A0A1V9XBH2_9ACAR|nr:39S ribosomal protein L55 [Tropilaelaps mercedesae]
MAHACAKRQSKMATSMCCMLKRFIHVFGPLFNSNEAFITRTKRAVFVRSYPTTLVQPDGSTFKIRYYEPRQIVQLPLRFEELSNEEKQIVIAKRRPKEIAQQKMEFDIEYDSKKYIRYVTKRKPTKA